MSFSYDGEELGYEEGYETRRPCKTSAYSLAKESESPNAHTVFKCDGKVCLLPPGAKNAVGWDSGEGKGCEDVALPVTTSSLPIKLTPFPPPPPAQQQAQPQGQVTPPASTSTNANPTTQTPPQQQDQPPQTKGPWAWGLGAIPPVSVNSSGQFTVGGDPVGSKTTSVVPSPPPAPGAQSFNQAAPVTFAAQPLSANPSLLEGQLRSRGLGREEIATYMTKFDNLKTPAAREAEIKKDLKRLQDDKEKTITGDSLREGMRSRARDMAVERFKASDVSPREAYDNLVARGLMQPKMEKGVDVNRPAADAKWSTDPKDKTTNPKNWDLVPVKGSDLKRINNDPLFLTTDFKTNAAEIRKDTERRYYMKGSYEKYKAWAMADSGNPPNYDKGLGIKDEAEARKRFDKLTTHLKLTKPDGAPLAFDPNATGENDPAQALFPVKEGESRFKDDGTVKTDVKFRHENLQVDDSTVNPVTRVVREQTAKELGRDTLFASLTGQVPEGSSMKVVKEQDKTFLVGPDGNKTEITVIDPPFTRKAALAYMQSKNLVDLEGAPLSDASLAQFANFSADIKAENVDREDIKNDITKWERQEIVKTLSSPPHNMKGQEILRYMQSKGWLGNNPNMEAMEDFRKRAAGAKAGSDEMRQINEEVKKADVVGNEPIEQLEKDRADEIRDMLDKKGKTDENRAGRGTSRDEGAANRDMQWRTAVYTQNSISEREKGQQKFTRTERLEKQKFDAKQAEIQRKHDSDEREKDRKNQMMMSLIQFLGSMITAAMQSMTSVVSASMQATQGHASNTVAAISRGRQ